MKAEDVCLNSYSIDVIYARIADAAELILNSSGVILDERTKNKIKHIIWEYIQENTKEFCDDNEGYYKIINGVKVEYDYGPVKDQIKKVYDVTIKDVINYLKAEYPSNFPKDKHYDKKRDGFYNRDYDKRSDRNYGRKDRRDYDRKDRRDYDYDRRDYDRKGERDYDYDRRDNKREYERENSRERNRIDPDYRRDYDNRKRNGKQNNYDNDIDYITSIIGRNGNDRYNRDRDY